MPKPQDGVNGSGLHANLSLWKDGYNAFADNSDPQGLSTVASGFAAGLMEHINAVTSLANPLVNSYKRLIPGFEAPVYVSWARHNRSPLIRVPDSRGENTRLELRSPDPSCNPYLAFAAISAAGIDGLRRGLTPPPMLERNIYDMTALDRELLGVHCLPSSLSAALDALEADRLILDTIGPHAAENYIKAKRMEWDEYSGKVHSWETDRYLARY
jgi:glutamine synthetase